MGFFQDVGDFFQKPIDYIGDSYQRAVANPAKLVADVSTLGLTAALRELPPGVGGGQSGKIAKGTEVYGATIIGAGTGAGAGFLTGGPGGALYGVFAGGAAGFGAGTSGVVHGSSGKQISVRAAEFGAGSGAIVGLGATFAGSGWGATSAVKTAPGVVYGPPTQEAASVGLTGATFGPVVAPAPGAFIGPATATVAGKAAGSSFWASVGTAAILTGIQRPGGQPGGGASPSVVVENVTLPPDVGPSLNPLYYPGAPGPNMAPIQPGSAITMDKGIFSPGGVLADVTSPTSLLVLAVIGILAYLVFK